MSKGYIEKEVDSIIDGQKLEFPQNIAMASAWILGNLKGINLKILDVKKTSSLSDYYVLASAINTTQARAMADTISVQLKRHDVKILSREGLPLALEHRLILLLGWIIQAG